MTSTLPQGSTASGQPICILGLLAHTAEPGRSTEGGTLRGFYLVLVEARRALAVDRELSGDSQPGCSAPPRGAPTAAGRPGGPIGPIQEPRATSGHELRAPTVNVPKKVKKPLVVNSKSNPHSNGVHFGPMVKVPWCSCSLRSPTRKQAGGVSRKRVGAPGLILARTGPAFLLHRHSSAAPLPRCLRGISLSGNLTSLLLQARVPATA